MKKNRMLRLASVLLVSVLLTTSVISGTFAKYTTSATATDTARVAKWGVNFSAATDLFSKYYKDEAVTETDTNATVKVNATDTSKLVAPGTKGTALSTTDASTGTPEVSYNMTIKLSNDSKVPTLKYTPTGGNATAYEPVKFSVYNGTTALKENMSLSDLTTLFNGTNVIYKYNVATSKYTVDSNLDGTPENESSTALDIKIKWEWAYEDGTEKVLYDKLDTVLGDTAAGETVTSYDGGTVSDINTDVKLDWTITATQID